MTGPDTPPCPHSALLGLADRHARRRAAARDAAALITRQGSRLARRGLGALWARLDDWTLLVLAAMAGGVLVSGAVYVLLLLPPDLARLPDPSGPLAPQVCGPVPAEIPQAQLLQPEVCQLTLAQFE